MFVVKVHVLTVWHSDLLKICPSVVFSCNSASNPENRFLFYALPFDTFDEDVLQQIELAYEDDNTCLVQCERHGRGTVKRYGVGFTLVTFADLEIQASRSRCTEVEVPRQPYERLLR